MKTHAEENVIDLRQYREQRQRLSRLSSARPKPQSEYPTFVPVLVPVPLPTPSPLMFSSFWWPGQLRRQVP
jgi:hypothetical protein